ncbi:hypothetical protein [Clostridium aciditolerans]|uniref:DUF4367 domain-containing protein n=1 Tax=Clostridium aciditolerans TaxID=339861 RepID=A0A934M4L2_9CLOT|nr:hypothetical protein [Clostridium aciditolerans]MBI6874140.1 hypothetical protein [Clostridium aciditolerans]
MRNVNNNEDVILELLNYAEISDEFDENLELDDLTSKRIKNNLDKKIQKRKNKIKYAVIACIVLVSTGLVFGVSSNIRASKLLSIDKSVTGYTRIKSYDKAPSKDKLKTDLGYEATIPELIPEGYKLVKSSISGYIDGAQPVEKQYQKKQASAIYSKHVFSPKVVGLSIWKVGARPDSPIFKNAKSIVIGNTTAYWTEYKKYIIPINTYNKMTQQQKDKILEDMKNGKATIQLHGGDGILGSICNNAKEKVTTTHALKWTENDVNYQLTDSDYGLSFEQMSKIAESIMNSK